MLTLSLFSFHFCSANGPTFAPGI